ncbi:MAG TPA: DNA polymerase III subunit epsilon [Cyanobacteria bacterium UBA8530]|nr:DNA polymerase III subunit epsilon [Cyanobacteria bacterium UBA8530]
MQTNDRFVVVDLETTGLSPQKGDCIVEIGAVLVEGGSKKATFQTLVDPRRLIPYYAQRVHGISDKMVKGAPTVEEAIPLFLEFAQDSCLVSHNARFDRGFLDFFHPGLGHPHLDTILLSRRLIPGLSSYKLDVLIEELNLAISGRHRALGDAEATADLLLHLMNLSGEISEILPRCLIPNRCASA